MRTLQVADAEIMQVALQEEILRSAEARYDHRLHGVLLVSRGLTCYEVAEHLGQNPVTVQRWVKRFNADGFAGLLEGERPGRPSRISPEQWLELEQVLRRSPRLLGYGQNLWDGKLLSHHLRELYNLQLEVRQCQRIFGKMSFRRRKPRPLIAKGDPEAQAQRKKKTVASPGGRTLPCGARMNAICSSTVPAA